MFRKFLSVTLSAVMTVSMLTPVFAGDNDKAYFKKALETTKAAYARENAMVNKVDKSSVLAARLAARPIEYTFDFGLTNGTGSLEPISGLLAKVGMKIDSNEGKHFTSIEALIPRWLSNGLKDINFNMNMYGDADRMAVNFPKISDKYYSIDLNMTEEQWEETALGESYSMDANMLEMVQAYSNALQSSLKMSANAVSPEAMKKLTAPYENIMNEFIERGRYTSEGTKVVDTSRGTLAVQKTSVQFTDVQMLNLLDALKEQVASDENLYSFLDDLYGDMGAAMGEEDMAQLYIDAIVSMLEYATPPEYLIYSIYTNTADRIYRHEVIMPGDYNDEEVCVQFDTVGKTNLLDEIYFTFIMKDSDDTNSFKASMIGNYVPVNGVFKSDFTFKAEEKILDDDGEEYVQTMDMGKAYYELDVNKQSDNFIFHANLGRTGDSYTQERPYDVNINILGDYIVDTAANTLGLNLKDINVTYGEEDGFDMYLSIIYQGIQSSDIAIPEEKVVDLAKMNEEEILEAAREIQRGFGR